MLISTIALALLTAIYVVLTYRILLAQSDPCVIVYVQPNEVWPTLLDIVIENVGPGLARDVRFEFVGTIPSCLAVDKGKPIEAGPLIDGIPALPPGGQRRICWGYAQDIQSIVGDKKYHVRCYFRRARGDLLNPEFDPMECVLDFQSFRESIANTQFTELAKRLEELSKSVASIDKQLGERGNREMLR